jgi:hypothetical protein
MISSDTVVKATSAEEECKKGVGLIAMFSQASKLTQKKAKGDPKGKKKANKGPLCLNCAKPGHISH